MRLVNALAAPAFVIILAAMFTASMAGAATGDTKTAEQTFKNIVQLKGTPADQLIPTMQFISASLGVECNFCHVEGKMDSDDKPAKKTAREMMAMMATLNRESFGGHREVTCYSCHHGAEHPTSTPPVLESDMPARAEHAPPARPTTITADQIIEQYRAAVGGEEAMKRTTSRVAKGEILVAGHETPIELLTKAPNKRMSISQTPNGESITAFDGTAGWLGNTGRPPREMSPAESEAAGLDAEFYLPLRLKENFPQLRVGHLETVQGAECNTLIGIRPDRPPVRFYFDAKTGLLIRQVRYGETPLGRNPTQIDYADYRDVDGVKIPFRWTLARTNGRFTIQLADVKANVPMDDSRFSKPTN